MPSLADIIGGKRVENHRPWPRIVVTRTLGAARRASLPAGRGTLLGLWGEPIRRRRAHGVIRCRGR